MLERELKVWFGEVMKRWFILCKLRSVRSILRWWQTNAVGWIVHKAQRQSILVLTEEIITVMNVHLKKCYSISAAAPSLPSLFPYIPEQKFIIPVYSVPSFSWETAIEISVSKWLCSEPLLTTSAGTIFLNNSILKRSVSCLERLSIYFVIFQPRYRL